MRIVRVVGAVGVMAILDVMSIVRLCENRRDSCQKAQSESCCEMHVERVECFVRYDELGKTGNTEKSCYHIDTSRERSSLIVMAQCRDIGTWRIMRAPIVSSSFHRFEMKRGFERPGIKSSPLLDAHLAARSTNGVVRSRQGEVVRIPNGRKRD